MMVSFISERIPETPYNRAKNLFIKRLELKYPKLSRII